MIPRSWTKNGWTFGHVVAAIVMTSLGLLVTLDAWQDIFRIAWKDEESSHIFLVPVITIWLIWVRRGRFRHCRPRGTLIGPILIVMGWIGFSLGDSYSFQSMWHGGAIVVVLGCLFSVLGSDVLFAYLPAVIIQVFLIPVPGRVRQPIAIPLESITTAVTQNLCQLMGFAAERSGNMLSLNGHDIEIAEACNGLRMVFALVLISFAFAFGTPLRWYVRLIVLIGSPISAIFCNVIRLLPTVWLYGYYPDAIASQFHDISGWLMLPIAFLLLMGIIKILQWAFIPVNYFVLAYD